MIWNIFDLDAEFSAILISILLIRCQLRGFAHDDLAVVDVDREQYSRNNASVHFCLFVFVCTQLQARALRFPTV